MWNEVKLTREDLYERVWKKPTVKVAEDFGISDVMVAKLCRKMDVPKPPPGYWQKLKAGAKIKATLLPKLKKSTEEFVYVKRVSKEDVVMVSESVQKLIDKEDLPENKIEVVDSFDIVHPLISKAINYLDKNNSSDSSLIELPKSNKYIDISLSKDQLNRGFLLLNTLFLALEERGYSVKVTDEYWGIKTEIIKEGESLQISLREKIRKVSKDQLAKEQNIPTYLLETEEEEYTFTGKLSIKVNYRFSSYKVWNDRKNDSLEDRLNEVMAHIVAVLEELVERKREKEAEELRRQEAIRLRREEEERRENLEADARKWHKSRKLQTYIDAYEDKLLELNDEIEPNSKEAEWLKWARKYANSLDPLRKLSKDQSE